MLNKQFERINSLSLKKIIFHTLPSKLFSTRLLARIIDSIVVFPLFTLIWFLPGDTISGFYLFISMFAIVFFYEFFSLIWMKRTLGKKIFRLEISYPEKSFKSKMIRSFSYSSFFLVSFPIFWLLVFFINLGFFYQNKSLHDFLAETQVSKQESDWDYYFKLVLVQFSFKILLSKFYVSMAYYFYVSNNINIELIHTSKWRKFKSAILMSKDLPNCIKNQNNMSWQSFVANNECFVVRNDIILGAGFRLDDTTIAVFSNQENIHNCISVFKKKFSEVNLLENEHTAFS